MAERWTMSTVVPTGGKVTPALLLGWALADWPADELVDVAEALPVEVAPAEEAVDVAVEAAGEFAPAAVEELDDPPQPVSSTSSEPAAAAIVHPVVRITPAS